MFAQVLKWAFLFFALIGAVYAILAVTVGRTRLLELCFGPALIREVDFDNLVLKESPNQYLVCPPDFCAAKAHAESPVFTEPVQGLKEKWFALVEQQPRTELIHSDPEHERFTFRVKTAIIHFPDDVTVQFIKLSERQSTLAIYSRSHYGHSDLGENQRRIASWLRELAAPPPG